MNRTLQHNLFGPPQPMEEAMRKTAIDLTTLTYSSMSDFQGCRRKYLHRHVDGLVPIEKPHALWFGSVTHQWLEAWHGTRTTEAAQMVIDHAYVNRATEPAEKRDWHFQTAMLRAYADQYPDEDFEVVDLEKEFSGPLVNPRTGRKSRSFIVRGKADGIVCRGNEFLLLEHKTASSITGDYLERLAMDMQIQLYSYYIRETLDHPISSIIYNVLVKPRLAQTEGETEEQYQARKAALVAKSKSGKSSAKRRMPESDEDFQYRLDAWFEVEPRFTRVELLLDFDTIANIRQQIWDIGKELLDARRHGRWHQNPRSCFGFGKCQYFELCVSKGNDMVVENMFTKKRPHQELSADDESAMAF